MRHMTASPYPLESATAKIEWPTLLLIVAAYSAWFALTLAYGDWPLAAVAPLLIVTVTLHSSLQHETIHGHPTRHTRLNAALVMLPLSMWLPYERYRANHLKHHQDERLTDPFDDPESYYWTPQDWQRLSPLTRAIVYAQNTLAGRIFIGSWWVLGQFWLAEWRSFVRNDPDVRRFWIKHLLLCGLLVLWLTLVCRIPLWLYICAVVIPGNGVLLIRSFAEHRARPAMRERIAIVERSRILGPLFLFNSLHALHHATPATPWYRLNALYQRQREQLLTDNAGLVYHSYVDVARRYFFRVHDRPAHPQGRVAPN
jgi:fatty acid desaturase